MTKTGDIVDLPENFREEKKTLQLLGINSWSKLKDLEDYEIFKIVKSSLSTSRNLKRLRCIAMFIYELEVSQEDAALLMHSGVSSIKSLAELTPHELLKRMGRLTRILNIPQERSLNLKKTNYLIQKAKNRQINN